MESIYAALLLHKAGGKINETNVEKVLTAAGAKVDKDQIVKLIAGLKDTKIEDIIKSASSAPVIATPAGGAVEKKKEKKKKEEEPEEEEEPTGIGSLF
ncbi:MAG: 50S ribosomal protein P1 [Candidatus Lokiarchaeota archaeon]|nr:50S ribosomal protein P1 [Candidatus Lokiarchaeota archaeon]